MSALLTGTAPLPDAGTVPVDDFEAIFLRFQAPITHFIYRLIGDREQACDLAQDVFVKAYKALLGGTEVAAPALPTWLYRIAAHTATDTLRRRRLITWLPLSLFYEARGSGVGVVPSRTGSAETAGSLWGEQRGFNGGRFEDGVAEREIITRAFERMSPPYARCLWLLELEDRSYGEIAAALSISESAVKMRIMRARRQFSELYRQEMGERGGAA